ncbi:ABC transporter ATP-binding protein, partial [Tepidimonas thermarum]|uniref:ABC transporter ATP-binding protein n=1 Tax=Tepidimonas thermarum TaxID=335431 RepID=UPI00117BF706
MSAETLIETHGLHTHYGASHILHGIDFRVRRGETIGLMGRNGMGKSTLLKTLVGLVRPSDGEVRVRGRPTRGLATFEVARLGVAYVPEGRGIFGNLSVRENLIMAARPGVDGRRDWTYERVLETFPRLAERLGPQLCIVLSVNSILPVVCWAGISGATRLRSPPSRQREGGSDAMTSRKECNPHGNTSRNQPLGSRLCDLA